MKNIYDVLEGLTYLLKNDLVLIQKGYVVDQGEYVNRLQNIEPWVGVYKGGRRYTPATLGHDALQWDNSITIMVIVQAAYYGSGTQCDELLEERIKEVLDAINSDHTLGGNVDMLNGIDIEYNYISDKSESILFQEAQINLTYEVAGDG